MDYSVDIVLTRCAQELDYLEDETKKAVMIQQRRRQFSQRSAVL